MACPIPYGGHKELLQIHNAAITTACFNGCFQVNLAQAVLPMFLSPLFCNRLIDWLRFYIQLDTKQVISETFFLANLLA